ncbi:MAG: hypothetical protein AAF320_01310 [Myxococcota bacterium]
MKFSIMLLGMSVVQGTWAWGQEANTTKQETVQSKKEEEGTTKQQQPDSKEPVTQSANETSKTDVPAQQAKQETDGEQKPSETDVTEENVAKQQDGAEQKQEAIDESVSSLPKIDSQLGIPPMEKFALYGVLSLREQVRKQIQDMAHVHRRLKHLGDNVAAFYETDARLVIFGENSMQRQGYQLEKAEYFLDGHKIAEYRRGSNASSPQVGPLFEGAVSPDCHTLKVRLDYLVKQRPFPYKTGYRVQMYGEQSFRMQEGQTLVLRSVGFTQEHLPAQGGKSGDVQAVQFVMQTQPNQVKGLPIVNLKDVLNEAGLEVSVQNSMPPEYKLIGFEVRLNGIPLKDYLRPKEAAQTGVLFRGPVLPGKDQQLQVQVTYQGQEKNYGYLGQHQFALNFERKIQLAANATTPVRLTAFLGEPASFTVEKTPSVRMEISQASVNTKEIELVDTCKSAAYFKAKQREGKRQNQQQGASAGSSETQGSSPGEQL